jgi:predicted nucleic acid-binding protein
LILLDASAVVSILLDPGLDAEPIRERIERPVESVYVPHLLDVEVLNVLRHKILRGRRYSDTNPMFLTLLISILGFLERRIEHVSENLVQLLKRAF